MSGGGSTSKSLDDKLADLRAENTRLRKTFEEDAKRQVLVREEVVKRQLYLEQLLARRVLVKELLAAKNRMGWA